MQAFQPPPGPSTQVQEAFQKAQDSAQLLYEVNRGSTDPDAEDDRELAELAEQPKKRACSATSCPLARPLAALPANKRDEANSAVASSTGGVQVPSKQGQGAKVEGVVCPTCEGTGRIQTEDSERARPQRPGGERKWNTGRRGFGSVHLNDPRRTPAGLLDMKISRTTSEQGSYYAANQQ